ncbi:hypothetical protein HUN03_00286 [Mycoplasmopsis anatis]|uniref:hypothetical protein n=1 Tax=Mycoplasmopsis anatis TaxID=171279 RepID=UPI001C4E2C81|nr:hypothetical protein [Mycoplasmopsis anatis]MBW0594696.1 hypothetical protein [Mycoplasmopsis anatis]MBW0595513.1 hypothetical protein [Mycoplasmopsis anatis]MBW0598275.1 hypothetical protein [Mycoplasmopsis anatis]MBW0599126.1 hypothetical protein [Mycoplasmopsis anatis]MBW0601133.1 hypothetical protein [Mycoplasmopsis anatis]
MKLLTYKEIKKNYNDFIDLIKSIDIQKLTEFEKIDEFNNLLSKTKRNKIDWILVIELTRFLIQVEELELLQINLFKFKKILNFSLDELQSNIKKYNQTDNTKEKIIELNNLINSIYLFTEEKENQKYSENIKNIIGIFIQLKQLNIVLEKPKNIKKSKKILVIISSIFAFLAISSSVSIPTTLHILSNNTQKNKKFLELNYNLQLKRIMI